MGAPTVFNADQERRMHEFLLDAWFMRIPRGKEGFALDIQHLLYEENRETKFTDNKPGNLKVTLGSFEL